MWAKLKRHDGNTDATDNHGYKRILAFAYGKTLSYCFLIHTAEGGKIRSNPWHPWHPRSYYVALVLFKSVQGNGWLARIVKSPQSVTLPIVVGLRLPIQNP